FGAFRSMRRQNAALIARSDVHDDVVFLDTDLYGLGHVRTCDDARAWFGRHGVSLRADTFGIAIGLAGGDIEFPAVPRATDELARAHRFIVTRLVRANQARNNPRAKAAALMRTAVKHAKKFAVQVEDRDRSAFDGKTLMATERDLARRRKDMPAHSWIP